MSSCGRSILGELSVSRSRAYEEGVAAGKESDTTEFDNPYRKNTQEYRDWKRGFEYIRGDHDTVLAGSE
jgi:hypothetical protein